MGRPLDYNKGMAVWFATGEEYLRMAEYSKKSFKFFHPDIKCEILNYPETQGIGHAEGLSACIKRFQMLEKMVEREGKVLWLGSDTLVLSRLNEVFDCEIEEDYDVGVTYNYIGKEGKPTKFGDLTLGYEKIVNSDVTVYRNSNFIKEMIWDMDCNLTDYVEMGALNRLIHKDNKYKALYVEDVGNSYYNNRSKLYFNDKQSHNMRHCAVKPDGVYAGDGKKIKVFHVCCGLYSIEKEKRLEKYFSYFKENFNDDFMGYVDKITTHENIKNENIISLVMEGKTKPELDESALEYMSFGDWDDCIKLGLSTSKEEQMYRLLKYKEKK